MAGRRQQRHSITGSKQTNNLREDPPHNTNGIMVGENREHFSLIQSSRRWKQHSYRSIRVSSVVAGGEPTSGTEDEDEDDDISKSLSSSALVPVKNRMVNYYHLMCRRCPKGRGVFLVLVVSFLETCAFFNALNGVRRLLPVNKCHSCRTDWESFVLSLLYSSAGRVFYPVAGVIADSYLGRYNVIHIGLWLLWVGFAVNSFSFCFLPLIPMGKMGKICKEIIAVVSVILFAAGSGSVEATIIPFGVDQLAQGASSDEISSYFYYYYITRNAAGMIAALVLFVVFDKITFFPHVHSNEKYPTKAESLNIDSEYIFQSLMAVLAVTIALLIVFCLKNQFYRDRQHTNALKSVTQVLCYAARARRQLPQHNRAFRYGGARTPRIDLAKTENDGSFSGEEVEDVKTCLLYTSPSPRDATLSRMPSSA